MPRDYKLYLEDILEAIHKIETYTEGKSFEHIQDKSMIIDAVLFNLEIIGEATKHIPESIRARYPEVEWRKISGLRDVVAHEYFGISLEIVWDILRNKLPNLRTGISQILMQNK